MRFKRGLLLLLILFFLCVLPKAQIIPFFSEQSLSPQKKYSVQFWTTENGLPQNSINSIVQTGDGYLWLATYDGLVQFDGIKFAIYNSSNTPELKTSGIRRLFVDHTDRVWMITSEGALLSHTKNIFTTYPLPEKIDYIKNTITVFNGEVLIVCGDNKLYRLTQKGFEPMQVPTFKKIFCIQAVDKKILYVGTDKGLWKFNGITWLNMPEFKEIGMSQLYVSPSSELIVDAEYKLYSVRGAKVMPIEIPLPLKPLNEYKLNFDETGRLVILTEHGVWIPGEKKISTITTSDGLSANVINSYFIDREKNIWVGTNNGGLNRLKAKLFKTFSKEDGMFEDGVTAITQRKNGSIMIGNNCKGTSEFINGNFVNKLKQLKNDVCTWSLWEDQQGQLWVGTYGGGVSIYRSNGTIDNYRMSAGLSDNVVFSIFGDSKRSTWIGTSNGLTCFSNNTFRIFDTSFHHKVTFITELKNTDVWLCTDMGLARIKDKQIVFPGKEYGLKEGAARYLYEDALGTLWLGTSGNGLVRIKGGRGFYFSGVTNQLDKNVWSITEDEKGNFWMPSNTGMYVVSKKELDDLADGKTRWLDVVYLGKEDGLKSIEFNGGFQPSALTTSDGKFWFPTVKGAVLADPAKLVKAPRNRQVIIEKLLLEDSVITLRDTLVVAATTRNISVFFTAPCFTNSAGLNFQYKTEGLDNDWNNLGAVRELKLNNIPEGVHKLRIRVAGAENGKEATLVISKPVPVWKQTRFIVGLIMGSFLFLSLVAFTSIRLIQKREKKKTQLNKQYANIELKALQAQLNPHFIFNCLNSIQHFIVANDEISATKYLAKFSLLMRMFLEHSKSNLVSLEQECELLKLYVEIESLRFKNGFDFELTVQKNIDLFNIQIPSMLFQPFVENAIKHGLLNLDRKGRLLISFTLSNSELVGVIDDDGVGRERAKEIRREVHKNHTSRGMEITNDRIAAINYIENTNIIVEVIDKNSASNGETGTRIIIKIPI